MREPKLLIFSSTEGLEVADKIQERLATVINVSIVYDTLNLYRINPVILIEEIENTDFVVLISAQNEKISILRSTFGKYSYGLSFELGLLVGHVGPQRIFVINTGPKEDYSNLLVSHLGVSYYQLNEENIFKIAMDIRSTITRTSQRDELYYPEEFKLTTKKLENYLRVKAEINLVEGHFYTDTISNRKAQNLYLAFAAVLYDVGVDVLLNYKEEKGSWLKRFIGGLKSNEELRKKLEEAEHAIKLATIDKVQSEIDKNQSESTFNLSEAAKEVDSCVFKIGSLLYVKYIDPSGRRIIQCRTLTRDEMMELEKKPEMLNSPEKILKMIEESKGDAT